MRNMSFALTTGQIIERSKTVTRRLGWTFLKPGDLICAVRKSQGLKKGEKVERLATLRILDVQREPLRMIIDIGLGEGTNECAREGFPNMTPIPFVRFFRKTHKGANLNTIVTRIEFEYE